MWKKGNMWITIHWWFSSTHTAVTQPEFPDFKIQISMFSNSKNNEKVEQ